MAFATRLRRLSPDRLDVLQRLLAEKQPSRSDPDIGFRHSTGQPVGPQAEQRAPQLPADLRAAEPRAAEPAAGQRAPHAGHALCIQARFDGEVDPFALCGVLRAALERHGLAVRSAGLPTPPLLLMDLLGVGVADTALVIDAAVRRVLEGQPCLDAVLVRVAAASFILVLTLHPALGDAATLQRITNDVCASLRALPPADPKTFGQGRPNATPPARERVDQSLANLLAVATSPEAFGQLADRVRALPEVDVDGLLAELLASPDDASPSASPPVSPQPSQPPVMPLDATRIEQSLDGLSDVGVDSMLHELLELE